jgi:molybdopterin synthase sulfur carrier subunit
MQMDIRLKLLKPFSDVVGKKELRLSIEGKNLDDLFRTLVEKYPKLEDQLYSKEKKLADHVNVFINDKPISSQEEMDIELQNGDEIMLFIPISGG